MRVCVYVDDSTLAAPLWLFSSQPTAVKSKSQALLKCPDNWGGTVCTLGWPEYRGGHVSGVQYLWSHQCHVTEWTRHPVLEKYLAITKIFQPAQKS